MASTTAHLFSGPEHRPFVPWRNPRISQPGAEVGIADRQWQDRRSQPRSGRQVQQRRARGGEGNEPAHCAAESRNSFENHSRKQRAMPSRAQNIGQEEEKK